MRNLSFFMVGKPLRDRGLVIIQGFCAVLEGGGGMRENEFRIKSKKARMLLSQSH